MLADEKERGGLSLGHLLNGLDLLPKAMGDAWCVPELRRLVSDPVPDGSPAPAARDPESTKRLASWIARIPGDATEAVPEDVAATACAVLDDIVGHVEEVIRDRGVMSLAGLVAGLRLPKPIIQRALATLRAARRVTQVGSHAEDDPDAAFQRVDPSDADRFTTILDQVRRAVDAGTALPDFLWPLLTLTNELLVDASHPDVAGRCALLEERAHDATSSDDESPDETGDTASEKEALRVELRGETLLITSFRRFSPLVRRVAHLLTEGGTDQRAVSAAVEARLPFRAGRTRYLAALQPRHANDTEFGHQVEVELGGTTVFFEANWPKSTAE